MTKKYKFNVVCATLVVLASANIVLAQSLATTTQQTTTATPVIAVPPSTLVTPTTDLTQPFTPEAPPTATTDTTQEPATGTTGTATTGTTAGTTTSTTGQTQETTETQILPEPVLPVLDIGSEEPTDTQEGLLTPTETTQSCDSDTAKAVILPPVIGNQIKVALMALVGAILGAILWVLGSVLIGSARGRGEILHIKTLERQELEMKRTETLAESKAALTDALDNVIKQTGAKSSVDHAQFEEYCRAAADLEILGSDATLQAHHRLVSMLSQQKPPAPEEFHAAKSHLLESLQNDIMGDSTAPANLPPS